MSPEAGEPRRAPERDTTAIAEIARGSTLNLGGAAILAATTLGVTVVVTRAFSRPAAGAFFTATSLFLILEQAAGLGANSGLVYFIARLRSTGGEPRIRPILRRALGPVLVSSIALTGLLLVFADPVARAMLSGHQFSDTSAGDVAAALRALAAALPFAALLDTLLGATRGYLDMRPSVALDRIGRSVLQLVGVLVAAALGTAALLAPLWALAYLPAATAAWIWLGRIRRRSPTNRPEDERATTADPGHFWAFTVPRALAAGAQIVIQRLDIVLVALLRGPVDAAIYTAATRFLVVGQLGNAAISLAAQPRLSQLFGLGDRQAANSVYQTTTGWLVLLTWPLYLLMIAFGPAVLTIFGHSYREGAAVMVILGAAMLVSSGCGQVDVVLTSTGRSALSLVNGLTALVVNVGVDLALIPPFGITGAAIGWAASIAAANLIPLAQLARLMRLHPFGRGTVLAGALTAVSFAGVPALVRAPLGDTAAAQVAAVAAGCVVFAAGLWRWREQLELSMIPLPRLRRERLLGHLLLTHPYGTSRPRRAAQELSLTAGRIASRDRVAPRFLIVGGQRCGTTTMYELLGQHPGVLTPIRHKEVHYFDVAYGRGFGWYEAHFPRKSHARRIERATGAPPLAFEATPYYMFHPLAPERIARDLPQVRLLVLLRDPVERAHSAHAHEVAMGQERLPFEAALELEDARLEGEVERIISEPGYVSHSHTHHAYRRRGHYVEQLERLEALFGRERLHVIDSGEFFAHPEAVYDAVLEFLGLPHRGYPIFGRYNDRPRSPMPESVRAALEEYFRSYDERLARWLGSTPSWRR